MITSAKLVISISACLSIGLSMALKPFSGNSQNLLQQTFTIDSTQIKAFIILDNKCNVCHKKRNRKRIFTTNNMDSWTNDIYKQVFIKRRMPKGKKIKLTNKDYQQLLTWITSTKQDL